MSAKMLRHLSQFTACRRLHLFLSLLLRGDEGGQSGGGPDKREKYAKVVSILHNIKRSEDAVDRTKLKVSHAICDLGLSIAKRLVNDQPDISGMTTSLTLPPTLYKLAENEDGKSVDIDEKSWLGSDSVLVQFEALKFEDKEPSVSGAAKDEIVLDEKDEDGNEMPLRKMMKILKSQGAKKKKTLKTHTPTSDKRGRENEVDVSGVVREINSDNLRSEPCMEIGDLTKDDDFSDCRRMCTQNSYGEVSVSGKRKESNGIAPVTMPTPKRKRSIAIQWPPKSTNGRSESRVPSNSRSNKLDKESSSFLQKLSRKEVESIGPDTSIKNYDESKIEGAITNDPVKTNNLGGTSDKIGNSSNSKGSLKKRKVRSISGLAKCSSHSTQLNNEELVGSRIKVWWPLDKAFYEGVVQSYVPGKKKHEILYDDGDVEVLNLNKQKWEPINSTDTPKKKSKVQRPSSYEDMPHEKINKKRSSSNSRQKTKSSMIRRKPAPKKSTELNSRQASESDAEGKGGSDLLDAHSHSGSDVDDVCSDEGHIEKNEEPPLVEAEEKAEEKSVAMPDESLQEEKPDPASSHDNEKSDDEPLSTWKMRAAKGE